METSHYAKKADAPNVALRVSSARTLLNSITKNFGTLPFCRRYLDRLGHEKYLLGVSGLDVMFESSYKANYDSLTILCPVALWRHIHLCVTLKDLSPRNLNMFVIRLSSLRFFSKSLISC